METLLINEQFVCQFKYWQGGQIKTGMRFRNDLFEYVSRFNQHQRNQAFDLAWQLAQKGKESIVTASPDHYTVWINLKADGIDLSNWLSTELSEQGVAQAPYSSHNTHSSHSTHHSHNLDSHSLGVPQVVLSA